MDEARVLADEWKLPIHLDGARIFNAAAALGCTAADIAARCDSIMFCLSKGLCAPVGSLLAGSKDFVEEARYRRKIMGGGMRQAGILAAAGLTALADHPSLLAEDHSRARLLETALAEIPGVQVEQGNINMVFFSLTTKKDPTVVSQKMVELFRGRGIVISAPGEELPDEAAPQNGDGAQGQVTSQGELTSHNEVKLVFRFVTHYWIGDKELASIIDAARAVFASAECAE
jgi:threonine aldolase